MEILFVPAFIIHNQIAELEIVLLEFPLPYQPEPVKKNLHYVCH